MKTGDNKEVYKKLSILSICIIVLMVSVWQLPKIQSVNNSALAIGGVQIPTFSAYGRALAIFVDDAVRHVQSNTQTPLVTHADMLDTMCLELGDTYLNKFAKGELGKNKSGDYGIVQFQPATFKRIAKKYRLFPVPRDRTALIAVMNNPEKSILVGAYYKNELLNICKRKGFRGLALKRCAAVAYNGGAGKIKAMPRDGSPPQSCYCTQSTKHLKLCQGKPILAKSQRKGMMHCITRKYGYDGLDRCIAEINNGGGNKLKSSLWRSLIANTNKLVNGQAVASVDANIFSPKSIEDIISRAKDFGTDLWYPVSTEEEGEPWQPIEEYAYINPNNDYDPADVPSVVYYTPYTSSNTEQIPGVYEVSMPVYYIIYGDTNTQSQRSYAGWIYEQNQEIKNGPFIPTTQVTIVDMEI